MFALVSRWLPLALIALAAFWLRTHELARRPMHADEANQAVKTGELLETGYYAFDPQDHHGPTLYYAALPIAWIRGEHSLASLTETTVRMVPAIFGTLGVILLGLIATPLGRWPALTAAALLAVAPPSVYYSRYFIQETLLATFTLGALLCAREWWRRGTLGWAIFAGVSVGLMQATKASAPLFLVAAVIALVGTRLLHSGPAGLAPQAAPRKWSQASIAALLSALVVAAMLFSSFGTHWAGLRDAIAVYAPATERATGGSGHEKPWWYYLQLFGWHRDGGLHWQQAAFSMAAAIGVALAILRRTRFLQQAAVYTLVVGIALSVIPYKTPWHSVHLVPGLSILAAGALGAFSRPWLGTLMAALVLGSQLLQTRLVVALRPTDARNPYAYVHSSADVLKARPLVDAVLARKPTGSVKVISEEYWPLPWYFRGLPAVGYWNTPPDACDATLIFSSVDYADVVRGRLQGLYRESYVGLRPGFLLVVFTRTP